ncbi:MAG: PDZ domain-containing protein [Bacilli bacterium]|nr:PDZ domain-containing protein [Bacilli bacterium]
MRRKLIIILLLLILPLNIYAYSNKIIVGGETIGMEIHSKGVYVVGYYKVNNKYIAKEAGFKIGDIITEINKEKITSITDLNNTIVNSGNYTFKVLRDGEYKTIKIDLEKDNNLIKSGLYVKDQINGIGTLSYIDPETRIFGSLGHEIIESTSSNKFLLDRGNIYRAEVKNINKSINGETGSKNASIDKEKILGEINTNEINGVYGKYQKDLNNYQTMEIAQKEEIKPGEAVIRTVLEGNNTEDFTIKIITIEDNPTKNILFEITDQRLLDKAGGIVQGMSGSPIIQNNKLIGVVNYVIVNDTNKGYGIFITTMLEEGDKSNS